MSDEVRLVTNCRSEHGEGPVWIPERRALLWTDIESPALGIYYEDTGNFQAIPLPQKLGSFAVIDEETILAAFVDTIAIYNWITRTVIQEVSVEKEISGTRMNDGRTDRSGRFVVSGFDNEGKGRSGIYQIKKDLSKTHWFSGISSGNSICFSPDGRIMYFADSPEAKIWAFDYDSDGATIANRRLLYDFVDEPGLPDGSVVDSEGYIWNAEWNGYRIIRISPEGRLDRVVDVPVKNPTCVAFGGDDLKTLYITTSRLTLTDEELNAMPTSGGLYAVTLDVPGIADARFSYKQ